MGAPNFRSFPQRVEVCRISPSLSIKAALSCSGRNHSGLPPTCWVQTVSNKRLQFVASKIADTQTNTSHDLADLRRLHDFRQDAASAPLKVHASQNIAPLQIHVSRPETNSFGSPMGLLHHRSLEGRRHPPIHSLQGRGAAQRWHLGCSQVVGESDPPNPVLILTSTQGSHQNCPA